jgi:hypothetical protein
MGSLTDDLTASRRTAILRLLVSAGVPVPEGVALKNGNALAPEASRAVLREDLDHLVKTGCLSEAWINPPDGGNSIRRFTATERGEDAAEGRVDVPGVWKSVWRR